MANYHILDIQNLAIKMANGDIDSQNKIVDYYTKYIDEFIKKVPNNLTYSKQELKQQLILILHKSINNYKTNYIEGQNRIFSSYVVSRIVQFYNGETIKLQNKKEYKNREIQALVIKMIDGDEIAKNKIIEYYTFHITKLIENEYSNYEKEDLIQIGIIGLVKAMNAYKIEYKNNFCSFATTYIKSEIKRALKLESKTPNIEYIGLTNNYNDKAFNDFVEKTEVIEAIKKLPDIKKKILFLHVCGKYTFEDIANMLGFTNQMAQIHYSHSIEFIKQELELQNIKQKKL